MQERKERAEQLKLPLAKALLSPKHRRDKVANRLR
jgi:hypothetical protein